jgi:hypothetical protein
MLLDPDPQSQYESGSMTAKSRRTRIPDPQHGFFSLVFILVSLNLNPEMAYLKVGKVALDYWVFNLCHHELIDLVYEK